MDLLDKNSQLRCGKSYYQNPYSGSHLDSGIFKNFADFTMVFRWEFIKEGNWVVGHGGGCMTVW